METVDAAARWRATWKSAWEALDVDAIVDLYAVDAVLSTEPFREPFWGRDGVRSYVTRVFGEEEEPLVDVGEAIVDDDRAAVPWWATLREEGADTTLAGTSVLRFDADGLVTEQWDTWNTTPERRTPPAGWAPFRKPNGSEAAEERLEGGWLTEVHRRGDVVHRSAGPWSRSVNAFLTHLAEAGFSGSPAVVGEGFDMRGRQTLAYLPGESPHPRAWSDDAARAVGAILRQLHDASASFEPERGAPWQPWFGRGLAGGRPVFGHCDLGPWNIVADGAGMPVGFIDWDFAGPVDAVWELAQVAWLNAHLHDEDVAAQNELPPAEARASQLRLIVDGYGLERTDRSGFVDRMVEFAVHSARQEALDYEVGVDTTAGVGPDGFPFVWGITWRTKSASWMLRHRSLLERAIAK